MPIRYCISPELNIILYIGEELMTGSEYFNAAGLAYLDERRKWGMITIVDILSVETDFDLEDMHHAIDFSKNLPQKGLEPEQVVLLTNSKGISLISNAIKMMSNTIAIKLDVVNTLDDLTSLLGFSERKQEFIQFYNECKFRKQEAIR